MWRLGLAKVVREREKVLGRWPRDQSSGEIPSDRERLWILGQYGFLFHFQLLPVLYCYKQGCPSISPVSVQVSFLQLLCINGTQGKEGTEWLCVVCLCKEGFPGQCPFQDKFAIAKSSRGRSRDAKQRWRIHQKSWWDMNAQSDDGYCSCVSPGQQSTNTSCGRELGFSLNFRWELKTFILNLKRNVRWWCWGCQGEASRTSWSECYQAISMCQI